MAASGRSRGWHWSALLLSAAAALARSEVYQEPAAFIAEMLGPAAQPRVLWLTKEIQTEATAILGHPPPELRERYWTDGHRDVWILEEIGKEQPITAGFVIAGGRIEHVRVLVYRESRGQEVRQRPFLAQFEGARLTPGRRLDHPIDGIAGATLSVGALERMARLALYLDAKSRQ